MYSIVTVSPFFGKSVLLPGARVCFVTPMLIEEELVDVYVYEVNVACE